MKNHTHLFLPWRLVSLPGRLLEALVDVPILLLYDLLRVFLRVSLLKNWNETFWVSKTMPESFLFNRCNQTYPFQRLFHHWCTLLLKFIHLRLLRDRLDGEVLGHGFDFFSIGKLFKLLACCRLSSCLHHSWLNLEPRLKGWKWMERLSGTFHWCFYSHLPSFCNKKLVILFTNATQAIRQTMEITALWLPSHSLLSMYDHEAFAKKTFIAMLLRNSDNLQVWKARFVHLINTMEEWNAMTSLSRPLCAREISLTCPIVGLSLSMPNKENTENNTNTSQPQPCKAPQGDPSPFKQFPVIIITALHIHVWYFLREKYPWRPKFKEKRVFLRSSLTINKEGLSRVFRETICNLFPRILRPYRLHWF